MTLLSAKDMQMLEQQAMTEAKIPSIVLMENAGMKMANIIRHSSDACQNSFCLIFIGPGNNGGDGFVIGRHLHQHGCQPVFFLLTDKKKISGDAKTNLDIACASGLPCHSLTSQKEIGNIHQYIDPLLQKGLRCHSIIDAIFGIGLKRDIAGHYKDAVIAINELSHNLIPGRKIKVYAVDIASGLNADTGQIMGCAVQADHTVTFHCAKPGHLLARGKAATGKLDIVDIGIPPVVAENNRGRLALITAATLAAVKTTLQRDPAAHKGSHGHILIVAGSHGSAGAAVLAAKGALRAGAGLVTLASTSANNAIFQQTVIEAMTMPLATSETFFTASDWPQIKKSLERYDAIVLGPGLGMHPETMELGLHIFHEAEIPVVVDADALNILAVSRKTLHSPRGVRIYTPHPGEMGRLLKCPTNEVLADSLAATHTAHRIFAAKKHPSIMVMKGAGTIVYDGDATFINTTGNPAMATGGMGDVLSGIIAALIGQKIAPLMAACSGVYLHGLAADILEEKTGTGFYASEVADTIPTARKQLLQELDTTSLSP